MQPCSPTGHVGRRPVLVYGQQRVLLLRLLGGVDYQARREARVCVQVFDRVGAGVDVCVDVDICVMYWVKIDSDLYSLDLRRDHYLDRAMYEGGGSPMKRGTWVFLCGVE